MGKVLMGMWEDTLDYDRICVEMDVGQLAWD